MERLLNFFILFNILALASALPQYMGSTATIGEVDPTFPIISGETLFLGFELAENTTECRQDIKEILRRSFNGEDWAKKYLDSAGTKPSGFMSGNLRWFGDFDQCRSIGTIHLADLKRSITSQYCRLAVAMGSSGSPLPIAIPNGGVTLGICAPKSCTIDEIVKAIDSLISRMGMKINPDNSVCILDKVPYTPVTIVTIVGFSVVGGFLLIGLIIDIHLRINEKKPVGKMAKLLLCFSPYTNFVKLMHVVLEDGPTPNLGAINGIRTLSLFWVILGHTYEVTQPMMDNLATTPVELQRRFSTQFLMSGVFAVDTFFFLSGFLAYWSMAKMFRGKTVGQFLKGLPFLYFHRYIRLTPPYLALLLIKLDLWAYFGSGPLYSQETDKSCAKYWWANLLYINNFVGLSDKCIPWSWYLANDMQFFIVVPFVVYLFVSKKPILGWLACLVAITGHVTSNTALTFYYQLPLSFFPPLSQNPNFTDTKRYDLFSKLEYVKPYTRMGPYVVGVVAAHLALVHGAFLTKRMFSKFWPSILMWFLSCGTLLTLIYSKYDIYTGKYYNPTWADALHNAFSTPSWGLAIGWILLACVFNKGGPVGGFLSWPVWGLTARLSYCGYLIHNLVLAFYMQTTRRAFNVTDITMTFYFLAAVLGTMLLAIPYSLAFEAPIIGLQRLLVKTKSKS